MNGRRPWGRDMVSCRFGPELFHLHALRCEHAIPAAVAPGIRWTISEGVAR